MRVNVSTVLSTGFQQIDPQAVEAGFAGEGEGAVLRERGSMADEDWAGYERTVRKIDTPPAEYEPGRYGAARRKRAKGVAA